MSESGFDSGAQGARAGSPGTATQTIQVPTSTAVTQTEGLDLLPEKVNRPVVKVPNLRKKKEDKEHLKPDEKLWGTKYKVDDDGHEIWDWGTRYNNFKFLNADVRFPMEDYSRQEIEALVTYCKKALSKYECLICQPVKDFTSESAAILHHAVKHPEPGKNKSYDCDGCLKSFKYANVLKSHRKVCGKIKNYAELTCKKCNQENGQSAAVFTGKSRKESFSEHVQECHYPTKFYRFQCKQCDDFTHFKKTSALQHFTTCYGNSDFSEKLIIDIYSKKAIYRKVDHGPSEYLIEPCSVDLSAELTDIPQKLSPILKLYPGYPEKTKTNKKIEKPTKTIKVSKVPNATASQASQAAKHASIVKDLYDEEFFNENSSDASIPFFESISDGVFDDEKMPMKGKKKKPINKRKLKKSCYYPKKRQTKLKATPTQEIQVFEKVFKLEKQYYSVSNQFITADHIKNFRERTLKQVTDEIFSSERTIHSALGKYEDFRQKREVEDKEEDEED